MIIVITTIIHIIVVVKMLIIMTRVTVSHLTADTVCLYKSRAERLM